MNAERPTAILGISAYYHDSAAALLRDGDIVAAAQEERFTRKKHDARFPENAIEYCLDGSRHRPRPTSTTIVFYDKPLVKFERLLETYLSYAPQGFRSFLAAMPIWLKEKLYLKSTLKTELREARRRARRTSCRALLFAEHHQSHAASAFYPSPFERAAVLCLDGVGEWATTTAWLGRGNELDAAVGDRLPALARAAVLGVHVLHRLQGELRRVQADGTRALRRAEVRGPDPRQADRPARTTARSGSTCSTSTTAPG